MRLIDADELYKLPCVHGAEGTWICLKDIHIAPTVDAELVKHGEWVPKITDYGTMVFRCSACRRFSDINWAYCPKCGTKMDGERKENGEIN